MPQESHLGFKVGMFVLLALIGLTMFIFSISDSSVFSKGDHYEVIFNFAGGVKKSAPVRIAGVDQGLVKDIKLYFDESDQKMKARMLLWITQNVKIPKDSQVLINQLGLMGEKYIEILPGQDRKDFYADGETIVGRDPILQERISNRLLEVADKTEKTIDGLSKIINDQANTDAISSTLSNFNQASGSLKEILQNLKDGKGTVGRLLLNEQLYTNLEEFSADLKINPWKLLYRPK